MKRFSIIFLILCIAGIKTHAGNPEYPRITYGAEWGYVGVFYSGYHYNFFAPEGYRVDPRGHEFKYSTNAEAYLHAGYNFNERYNLSVYVGVSAIEEYHHVVPMSIRFTWFYNDKPLTDRWFSYIDLGSGLSIKKHPQELLTGKFGGGYRVSLSRDTKLDFMIGLRCVLTHPEIEYYGTVIEYEKINRNNAYISAVSLGMALTF